MSKLPRVVSAAPKLQARATAARQVRRTAWLRRLAWGAAGLVPLALIAWLVLGTSMLGVRKVVITGEHRLTAAEVARAVNVARGTPLARVDTAAVARRVRALDAVASVTVTRGWPDSLRVLVVERTAAVAVPDGSRYALLDDQGVRFDIVSTPPRGVVRLEGTTDPAAREAALTVVRDLPLALRRAVWVVRASSPQQVSLVLRGNRVLVWGSTDQSAQKAAAALALLKLPGKTYDVSSPTVVTRR
ncbi:MAG: peptidase [Frankiales bacterium]|nr:peptidase [Frankiales bacterium]